MHFLTLMATEVETLKNVDIDVDIEMERFSGDTNNPDYLEFCDFTEDLKEKYEKGTVNCIKTADGRLLEEEVYQKYEIFEGKVYQRQWGQLHCRKRTKIAKKMQVIADYPISKLYCSLDDFADSQGISFYEEQNAYGYYHNPTGFCDWYEVGGRWSQFFLVKDSCAEFLTSEGEEKAKDGYKWVYAARKKDIEWNEKNFTVPCLLVKDGEWVLREDEQSADLWRKTVREWFDSLSEEAVIVVVDCHG